MQSNCNGQVRTKQRLRPRRTLLMVAALFLLGAVALYFLSNPMGLPLTVVITRLLVLVPVLMLLISLLVAIPDPPLKRECLEWTLWWLAVGAVLGYLAGPSFAAKPVSASLGCAFGLLAGIIQSFFLKRSLVVGVVLELSFSDRYPGHCQLEVRELVGVVVPKGDEGSPPWQALSRPQAFFVVRTTIAAVAHPSVKPSQSEPVHRFLARQEAVARTQVKPCSVVIMEETLLGLRLVHIGRVPDSSDLIVPGQ